MSKDVNAVVRALFEAGVTKVTVKDFHRTGFNLLPELIDDRAHIDRGYRRAPVPGLGDPGDADADTLAGLILEVKGEIPSLHEQINLKNFTFTIEERLKTFKL